MSAVVTFAGNTPRNIQLDRSVGAGARQAFERPWNRSHLVRTALSVASLVLLCRALLLL